MFEGLVVVLGLVIELLRVGLVVVLELVGRVVVLDCDVDLEFERVVVDRLRVADLVFDRVLVRLRVVALKTLRLLRLLEFLYLDLPPLMYA